MEIRRRALHAAAAVSFTVGLVACGTTVLEAAPSSDGAGGTAGAPAAPPTASTTTTTEPAVADAGPICVEGPDYLTCCEQHNWDYAAGCLAWGPPTPPAMELEVA